jgi:hypothetical protein
MLDKQITEDLTRANPTQIPALRRNEKDWKQIIRKPTYQKHLQECICPNVGKVFLHPSMPFDFIHKTSNTFSVLK